MALVAGPASASAAQPVSGAIFTTDSTCSGVNINIFDQKSDAYIDGGPAHPGAAGLPPGNYYVQVTDPSGATVLGKSAGADVTVNANGDFASCYQLTDILYSASSGYTAKGYDDTPNAGGEYKVWISTVPTFDNNVTKTDNYKVKEGAGRGTLTIEKCYDANANGSCDPSETLLNGWKTRIQDNIDYVRETPVNIILDPDTYCVSEFDTVENNWVHTGVSGGNPITPIATGANQCDNATLNPNAKTATTFNLPDKGTQNVKFANLCLGAGGGLTLGFWSNPNGQALIGSDDLTMLRNLHLRNANGSNFDPTTKAQVKTWLLSATATNMAYMLSAQFAAMELNVFNGKVNGNSLIYAPGTSSANALGFATVNAVMAEANTELGLHGLTVAAGSVRSYQEALKNALDNANNNKTFVQSTPCPYSFAG